MEPTYGDAWLDGTGWTRVDWKEVIKRNVVELPPSSLPALLQATTAVEDLATQDETSSSSKRPHSPDLVQRPSKRQGTSTGFVSAPFNTPGIARVSGEIFRGTDVAGNKNLDINKKSSIKKRTSLPSFRGEKVSSMRPKSVILDPITYVKNSGITITRATTPILNSNPSSQASIPDQVIVPVYKNCRNLPGLVERVNFAWFAANIYDANEGNIILERIEEEWESLLQYKLKQWKDDNVAPEMKAGLYAKALDGRRERSTPLLQKLGSGQMERKKRVDEAQTQTARQSPSPHRAVTPPIKPPRALIIPYSRKKTNFSSFVAMGFGRFAKAMHNVNLGLVTFSQIQNGWETMVYHKFKEWKTGLPPHAKLRVYQEALAQKTNVQTKFLRKLHKQANEAVNEGGVKPSEMEKMLAECPQQRSHHRSEKKQNKPREHRSRTASVEAFVADNMRVGSETPDKSDVKGNEDHGHAQVKFEAIDGKGEDDVDLFCVSNNEYRLTRHVVDLTRKVI